MPICKECKPTDCEGLTSGHWSGEIRLCEQHASLESEVARLKAELAQLQEDEKVSEELHYQKTEMMHQYDDAIIQLEKDKAELTTLLQLEREQRFAAQEDTRQERLNNIAVQQQVEGLKAELASAREALRYYANHNCWMVCEMDVDQTLSRDWKPIENGFAIAEKALASREKE